MIQGQGELVTEKQSKEKPKSKLNVRHIEPSHEQKPDVGTGAKMASIEIAEGILLAGRN